jgi:hypothetical protein
MAEKKKAAPKSTKAEKNVKIDPQANGSAQPGFAIENFFLKMFQLRYLIPQKFLHNVRRLKSLLS